MRRITLYLLISSFVVLATAPASGSTVDEVIANHIAARGGMEAWERVHTLKATGSFTAFSKVGSFTLHRKRGNKLHLDHVMGDKPVEIGFDGEVAWWVNLWNGIPWAQKISGLDHAVLMQDVDFESPFFNYREKGYTVKLGGEDALDGQKVIKLMLTRPDDSVETWYLDPETYLEVAYDAQGSDFGSPFPQRAYFEDFREVDGLVMPHFIEKQWYTRDRIMEIEKVETNIEIDDAVFSLPLPGDMESLQSMAGKWKVNVEQRDSPQAPWAESEMTSTVEARMDGALLEERFTQQGFQTIRSLTFDRFKEQYRLSQLNSFTGHLDIQEGQFENGRLTTSNAETGTPWVGLGQTFHERLSIFNLSEDGFEIEAERSIDGGENWFVSSKATYSLATE